jgi:hypothetical protein
MKNIGAKSYEVTKNMMTIVTKKKNMMTMKNKKKNTIRI